MPSNHLILCHPFLLLPSIFPSIMSFPMIQLFVSGGQSIGASATATILPINIQGWFPFGVTGLISLQSKRLWRIESFTIQIFVSKVMSLLFNMLSRLVIVFLPRSKCVLISWLQSPPAEILETKKVKSVTVSIVSPFICHEVMGPNTMIFVFWMLALSQLFHSPLWLSSRGFLVPLHFLP